MAQSDAQFAIITELFILIVCLSQITIIVIITYIIEDVRCFIIVNKGKIDFKINKCCSIAPRICYYVKLIFCQPSTKTNTMLISTITITHSCGHSKNCFFVPLYDTHFTTIYLSVSETLSHFQLPSYLTSTNKRSLTQHYKFQHCKNN